MTVTKIADKKYKLALLDLVNETVKAAKNIVVNDFANYHTHVNESGTFGLLGIMTASDRGNTWDGILYEFRPNEQGELILTKHTTPIDKGGGHYGQAPVALDNRSFVFFAKISKRYGVLSPDSNREVSIIRCIANPLISNKVTTDPQNDSYPMIRVGDKWDRLEEHPAGGLFTTEVKEKGVIKDLDQSVKSLVPRSFDRVTGGMVAEYTLYVGDPEAYFVVAYGGESKNVVFKYIITLPIMK